jgi:hypothetical protein
MIVFGLLAIRFGWRWFISQDEVDEAINLLFEAGHRDCAFPNPFTPEAELA